MTKVIVKLPKSLTAASFTLRRWEGTIMVEGEPTGDGRLFEPGALRWESLPIPFAWAEKDLPEHMEAVVVGRVVEVWRDGNNIMARGDINTSIPEGAELVTLLEDDGEGPTSNGVSVDLDDIEAEVRVAQELLEAEEALFSDEVEEEPEEREVDEDGRVTVWEFASDDELFVTTSARLRGLTAVRTPAIESARIFLTDDEEDIVEQALESHGSETLQFPCPKPFDSHDDCVSRMGQEEDIDDPDAFCAAWEQACGGSGDTVTAAGGPVRPARGWFMDPKFGSTPEQDPRLVRDEDTGIVGAPLTVTDDGRVFGHLALWKSCHTGYSQCVNPPTSPSSYRYFHVGAVVADDGTEVPVGRLTVDTLHAGKRLTPVDTLAHYENTGLAVADVRAGEDEHGVWIAGALRPSISDEQLRVLRASPPSGDWRRIGGALELVAALAVNNPGFPVPRAMVASAGDGEQVVKTLQHGNHIGMKRLTAGLTSDERTMLKRMLRREKAAERKQEVQRLAQIFGG